MSGRKKGVRIIERLLGVDRVAEEAQLYDPIERLGAVGALERIRFGPSLIHLLPPVQWRFLSPVDDRTSEEN